MSSFITPLLWAFVPSYLTSQALPILSTYLPGVFPPSSPGSPAYARNYRVTFTLFVCGYLVWSFFNSGGVKPDQNWYTLLAVSRDAEDERLKTAFRTLSRTYHPDRAGGGDESRFILIRQAYETLSDPIKRYAYDRFGPDIVLWKECKTVKDFIYAGIVRSVGFYIFSGGVMVLITVIGRVQQTSYWNKNLFAMLLFLELYLILSPTPAIAPILSRFTVLGRPQFAQVELAHRLWASLSIAINQLAGVWAPQEVSDEIAWNKVSRLIQELDAEAAAHFQSEIVPLMVKSGHPVEVQAAIQQGMEQILVDRTISSHPVVKDAWQAAVASASATAAPGTPSRFNVPPGLSELEVARRIPLPPSPRLQPRQ